MSAKNGRRVDHRDRHPHTCSHKLPQGSHPQNTVVLRHTQLTAGPQVYAPGDFSSSNLVLPGPVMGNPGGPRTGGYGWPAPNLEEAIPPGLESPPTPPAKGVGDDRAATRAMR